MATPGAFTPRDHPVDRATRLNALRARVDAAGTRTISVDFAGMPSAGQRLARLRSPRAGTIAAIAGDFDTPASATTPFLFKAEGATIAELPANDDVAEGAISNGAVAAGALLELFAPAIQDATLSGGLIRITLAA